MKKQGADEVSTAEKIMEVAKEIFMAKGFDGTSINDIAHKASINKSLIYHHFKSKADLWKAVKINLLESHIGGERSAINFPMGSFETFLENVVTLRFNFYNQNPSIVRLIAWQRLEEEKEAIQGITHDTFTNLTPQIKEFQHRGEVRKDLNPEMVSYFILFASSLPFMEVPSFFQAPNAEENKEKFLTMLIKSLYLAFSSPS